MIETATKRLDPKVRKEEILVAAVEVAQLVGLDKLRRDAVAERAGVANGLVSRYFNTMLQLRHAVVRYAVQKQILSIIAQGLAAGEVEARKAPEDLKRKALASLSA